jgi:hypothetical protein
MPSVKLPTSLRFGPGKLPANVVSASALTIPSGTPANIQESDFTVLTVSSATTLPRLSKYLTVVVSLTGTYTIKLPLEPHVGDVVTFIGAGASGSGLKEVTIQAASGALFGTIHGFNDTERLGAPPFPARSFVCIDENRGWAAISERPATLTVNSSVTLPRAGSSQVVLVDTTTGDITLTLPARSQLGDVIVFIKTVSSANSVTITRGGSDLIDGRPSTVILSNQGALTLARTSSTAAIAWTTVSESASVVTVTDTISLAAGSANSANEIHVLVQTSNAAWVAGTKTITLPTAIRVGATLTISDVDGTAATNNVKVSGVLGVSSIAGTAQYVIAQNYGSVTLIAKSVAEWSILSETHGLVEDFTALARVDGRVDSRIGRLQSTPMFNWSARKVALHAEFAGLITNILPVDGFTAGGDGMLLSRAAGVAGEVGVLRCTVADGTSGYIHLGDLPTSNLFSPTQLLGFRAILRPVTASPGVAYLIDVGFGDNIDAANLGANGLFLRVGGAPAGSVVGLRQASGVMSTTLSAGTVVVNKRYVLEYYFSDGTWDPIFNGSRLAGGSANIPVAPSLNFGMRIYQGAGAPNVVVDVDSFTIFTADMGSRFTP